MNDKKEKWEIQYEDYKNGGLDKKLEELKAKHDNKEIDMRQYMKEKKQIDKIRSNLPKVEHLVELRNELKELKEEIENELVTRENDEIQTQMQKLDQENEVLLPRIEDTKKKLKNPNLSDNDRKSLESQLSKDESRLKTNNDKYLEMNEKKQNIKNTVRTTDISKMSKQDLKKNYQIVCMKLSRNNFYAKRLLKGYDLESVKVEDKKVDWASRKYDLDVKKLMAKGKEAEKMKALKDAIKDENYKDVGMEEKLGAEIRKIMEEKKESTAMVEVSEFEQKHPKLVKINKFFSNIKDKIKNIIEEKNKGNSSQKLNSDKDVKDKDINANKDVKGKEMKDKDIDADKDVKDKDNKENNKINDKRGSFMKRLRDMNEYEIFDVAEKGIDGLKEEKMSEAKRKLIENKQKSAEASKAKYEQGMNDYYKSRGIDKSKTDTTNYIDNMSFDKLKNNGR